MRNWIAEVVQRTLDGLPDKNAEIARLKAENETLRSNLPSFEASIEWRNKVIAELLSAMSELRQLEQYQNFIPKNQYVWTYDPLLQKAKDLLDEHHN